MNLDDYAYQEDDRWYVNPQVSLDEQNNFINTLRQVESRNNDQIVSQTRGLGTQIPSQLGGLGGGSSYFRSRYQTPQTNHAIADLRASAQAQAFNTMLNNEIEKAKKQYQDAYRAANVRSSNKGTTAADDAGLFETQTKDYISSTPTTEDEFEIIDDEQKNNEFVMVDGVQRWRDNNGELHPVRNLNQAESMSLPFGNYMDFRHYDNGQIIEYKGHKYLYVSNGQRGGKWYVIDEE